MSGNPPPGEVMFRPSTLLRHAHIQSILASKSPRRRMWLRRGSAMEACARYHELVAEDGARLSAWHSPQPPERRARSLVVLIHGWEGCHESAYLYSMACALHVAGHAVLRLNLRDHGESFHLNEDIFHSGRIDETVDAIAAARRLEAAELPLFVVGFSLGGNFALRTALRGPGRGLRADLCIGISPVMDPLGALRAIDDGPRIYHHYFMDKWRRSLRAKATAWPQRWRFDGALPTGRIVEATQRFAERFLSFGSVENYYRLYHLTADQLTAAPAPLAVITAQDDPIIPFGDFAGLRKGGSVVSFDAPARGGHCGFIENLGMEAWTEKRVLAMLDERLREFGER